MEDIPIHASARRGRAEEAEGAEGGEGDAESHYTMADSVCAGGTVERTRRTARPRTAGTACSSWPEGVPRDFSLEASKAPALFHQKWCSLGMSVGLGLGRDHEPHYGRREGMVLMPYDPLWVGQLAGLRGRTVEPAAGPRGTRCAKAVFL